MLMQHVGCREESSNGHFGWTFFSPSCYARCGCSPLLPHHHIILAIRLGASRHDFFQFVWYIPSRHWFVGKSWGCFYSSKSVFQHYMIGFSVSLVEGHLHHCICRVTCFEQYSSSTCRNPQTALLFNIGGAFFGQETVEYQWIDIL